MVDKRCALVRCALFLSTATHVRARVCPHSVAAQRTTGSFKALLERLSLADAVLVAEKRACPDLMSVDELRTLLDAFKPLVDDVEARNRVKRCSLMPVSVVAAACSAYGRCAATVALMKALHQLPRAWGLAEEQDANHRNLEHDLLVEDELQELEEEGVHLAAELERMLPFERSAQDEEKAASWRLARVPAALERELDAYAAFRAAPLSRAREGGAVMPITAGNDKATALRFLGWLEAEKQIQAGLGVFAKAELSAWVEEWLRALQERELMFSSLANYANSLIAITHYVYATYQVDDCIHSMVRNPLDEMIRLRGQCESEAKQQRLFQKKPANWIEWPAAQEARAKAERLYRAKKSPPLLRDWLILSLHTVMPPDRVGCIRKLRLGMSLKRCGEGFVLDLTQQRMHKTSRFQGPTIQTLSAMLTEPLNDYLSATLQYESVENDTPYLFHPQGDTRRCVVSSQWSQMVKATFSKHAGVACPPKLLRASFITWLKDTTADSADAGEVLKSAANAMRHQEATQGSDRYDKAHHDRLNAAAMQYTERFARQYTAAPAPDGWARVEAPNVEFVRGEAGKYACKLPPQDWLRPDTTYRWPIVPGVANGFTWKTPSDIAGKTLALALPNCTLATPRFTVTGLLVKSAAPPEEDDCAATQVLDELPSLDDLEEETASAVETMVRPPIPLADAHAALARLGVRLGKAAENGDCFPLSVEAGRRIVPASDAAHPGVDTIDLIDAMRKDAVALLCGERIDGVDARVVREHEGLPIDPEEAEEVLADWRTIGHFRRDGEEHLSAAFMFAIAAAARPTIVLEVCDGAVLDPCALYAERRADGSLLTTPARGTKPETVPFLRQMAWSEVLSALEAAPAAHSVVQYDRAALHHAPLLYEAAAQPEAAPAPVAARAEEKAEANAPVAPPRPPPAECALADALAPWALATVATPPREEALHGAALHGRLVAFRWEEYGWAVGRLGAPRAADSNFSVTYEGESVEQQTLLSPAYGGTAYGAWWLLAPCAPPIGGYARGRYLVGGTWRRAAELPHAPTERAAARAAAAAAAPTYFAPGRCESTRCTLGAGHSGLCSHLRVAGKRRREG
jgi:hypothetical protein